MVECRDEIKKLVRIRDSNPSREKFLRLDKNERITPFTPEQFQKMIGTINPETLTIYPDPAPLLKKLAEFLGLPESMILLTPGSDSALKMLFETYIDPGDKILFLKPTYAMIEVYAHMFNAIYSTINFSDNLTLDIDKLVQSITSDTKLVYIANPNQPTGTILSDSDLRKILEKTQATDTLLVIDEAYGDFSKQNYSLLTCLKDYKNLVLTRTFSKAAGLASVRLGYIISAEENINNISKVKPLSDINTFAILIGEFIIDNFNIVTEYILEVNTGKSYIINELNRMGLTCIDSHTNFIHIKFPESTDRDYITRELGKRKILVRNSGMGLPAVIQDCIRITVGPKKYMERFLDTFKEILNEMK